MRNDFISECYEIVKTFEIVANNREFRVEILRDDDGNFHVRGFEFNSYHMQPSYPCLSGKRTAKTVDAQFLKSIAIPWISATELSQAKSQALKSLERYIRENPR